MNRSEFYRSYISNALDCLVSVGAVIKRPMLDGSSQLETDSGLGIALDCFWPVAAVSVRTKADRQPTNGKGERRRDWKGDESLHLLVSSSGCYIVVRIIVRCTRRASQVLSNKASNVANHVTYVSLAKFIGFAVCS